MRRPFYVFSNGRLRRRHHTLCLERADETRTPGARAEDTGLPSGAPTGKKVTFPVEQVESLYLFGEVDLNTKLVTFLASHHIPVFFFDYYGNFTATLYPRDYLLSGYLTVRQVRHYLSTKRRLRLARAFVEAATYNIARVLKYYVPRLPSASATTVREALTVIEQERARLRDVTAIDELMGLEGRCRETYYRTWPALLGEHGHRFPFERRERRPPSNELNALISFGNALCYSAVLRQIYRTALDPTVSFLHEPGRRRFSLALDLAEVFKPLLVDRAIFRLIKTGALTPKHFEPRLGGTYLKDDGRKVFVAHWDERLRKTVQHRELNRRISYERLVRLECHKLTRHLCDPKRDPYKGFHMWW
ncbi:type I-B CRISPR-associated endonuclease Cas1b [Rhodocaloribacter sp.]